MSETLKALEEMKQNWAYDSKERIILTEAISAIKAQQEGDNAKRFDYGRKSVNDIVRENGEQQVKIEELSDKLRQMREELEQAKKDQNELSDLMAKMERLEGKLAQVYCLPQHSKKQVEARLLADIAAIIRKELEG